MEVKERCLKLVRSSKAQNRFLLDARRRLKKKLFTVSQSKERIDISSENIYSFLKEKKAHNRNILIQRAIEREKAIRNLNITLNDQNLTHKVFELGTTLQNWRRKYK